MRPDEFAEQASVRGKSAESSQIQPCCRAVYYEVDPFLQRGVRLGAPSAGEVGRPWPRYFQPHTVVPWTAGIAGPMTEQVETVQRGRGS